MKKISTKVIIAVVLLTVVSLSSFAMLSFSLADENNGLSDNQTVVFAESNSYTNIDRIIENSKTGDYGDNVKESKDDNGDPIKDDNGEPIYEIDKEKNKIYHIVEITSNEKSSLETLCDSIFRLHVIDGHRSIEDTMAENPPIDYKFFVAGNKDSVDDQVDAIKKADLIYVHNDPTQLFDDKLDTDIQEEVKLALSTAATRDHIPFIIDSYKGTINNSPSAKTYNSLVSSEFKTSLSTYAWPNSDTASISDFFGMKIVSAFYTRINGTNTKVNWTDDNKAKILVIGSGTLYSNISGKDTELIDYGYMQTKSLPSGFVIDEVSPSDDLSSYDLNTYDYIILDSGCANQPISNDNYNSLAAAAYSRVHILFSSTLNARSSSSAGSSDNPGSSYGYVYEKVATSAETPKFGNVLVTNFAKMNIYASATRPKTVDDIANIIINGSFRGINGNDSGDDTSNVYTVLEIEPSYPIDSNLARAFYEKKTYAELDNEFGKKLSFINEKFGTTDGTDVLFNRMGQNYFYFLRTNSVLNGETEDEVSFDGQIPLSMFEDYNAYANAVETTQKINNSYLKDYYRWRLSKAKIAHATGLEYNQVKVVHMSSAEFNASREALADAYDAIYIGGDLSNQKAKDKWANGGQYRMYYRDGDNNTSVPGSNQSFRSNDISNDKKDELVKYASSLPVIIDSEVVDAITKNEGVDPNSNMGKAIASIQSLNNGKVLNGFDSSNTIRIINPEGKYGNTYGGIVTVFAGAGLHSEYEDEEVYYADSTKNHGNESTNGTALRKVLTSVQRPKLSVSTPREYVETDNTTWITKDDFNFTYTINGASSSDNITATLYVDENGNGRFEDTEIRCTAKGSNTSFNPATDPNWKDKWIGSDYFGPVYWKLVVTDSGYGTSTSTTALSKVKRTNQDKMKVKLLQIAPETKDQRGADASHMTLYLCTECQMSKRIMHGNLSFGNNNGRYSQIGTDSLNKIDGHTDEFTRGINNDAKNILKLSDTPTTTGDVTYPDSLTISYHNDNWSTQGNVTVSKGGSQTLRGLPSGKLTFVIYYPLIPFKVSTSNGNQSGTEVTVNVGNDGIARVDYQDPEAQTIEDDTEKDYKYIVDFLTIVDKNYSYTSYGNDLGIHEHKFGIVKYDAHEKRYRSKDSNDIYQEGFDKLNTNWFLDFQNDYEVETTILDIPQYTEYVNNVEATYSDVVGDREQVKAKRDTFYKKSKKFYSLYNSVRKLINGTKLSQIDDPKTEENEKDELVKYLKDEMLLGAQYSDGKLTYKINPEEEDVVSMLNAFGNASSNLDEYLTANRETIYSSNVDKINCKKQEYDNEIDFYTDKSIEPTQRSYYFFFSLFTDQNEKATPDYAKLYVVWRDAKILEQFLYHEYKENELYSSVYYEDNCDDSLIGKFNLKNAFTCVAIGCAEGFNDQDISDEDACYAIKNYADDNGSVLLFHDSLCPSNVPHLKSGTPTMTKILSEAFGQGANSDSTTKTDGYSVTQKTLQMQYHDDLGNRGYMSQQSNNYHDYMEETDNQFLHSSKDVREFYADKKDVGADRANRVNKGIITSYPFTIDDNLTISPTNANGFTANTDDKDMVVYYTISGGSLGTSSTPYVANKNDGADNYFLYQYHNITYTGAGHAAITGKGRDNNDERRLFINVILNSARKSTAGPDLTLHDYSSTDDVQTNSIIKISNQSEDNGLVQDKAEYYTYVNSYEDTPVFSFRPTTPDGVKSIKIWYDVSNGVADDGTNYKGVYNEKADDKGNKDVLIYNIDINNVKSFKRLSYIYSEDEDGNITNSFADTDVSSSLAAEHVESGKVKRVSDDTGSNRKSPDIYGRKRLEGYNCSPILDSHGNWTFEENSDKSDYVLDNDGNYIPLVTHYSNLKLNESYFTGNDGKYAYICVQLTDKKDKPITRTIRIELKPELLELN